MLLPVPQESPDQGAVCDMLGSSIEAHASTRNDAVQLLDSKASLQRDRDHNAAPQWVEGLKWPAALDWQVTKKRVESCILLWTSVSQMISSLQNEIQIDYRTKIGIVVS